MVSVFCTRLWIFKEIVVVQYTNLPAGSERELFQRVQLGVTLTNAGRMPRVYREYELNFQQKNSKLFILPGLGKWNSRLDYILFIICQLDSPTY